MFYLPTPLAAERGRPYVTCSISDSADINDDHRSCGPIADTCAGSACKSLLLKGPIPATWRSANARGTELALAVPGTLCQCLVFQR